MLISPYSLAAVESLSSIQVAVVPQFLYMQLRSSVGR